MGKAGWESGSGDAVEAVVEAAAVKALMALVGGAEALVSLFY